MNLITNDTCHHCGFTYTHPVLWMNGRVKHVFCDNDCLVRWVEACECVDAAGIRASLRDLLREPSPSHE
jgi:hypothetical protein